VISRAILGGVPEMSLACKGARVLGELAPGEMLVAIPGPSLAEAVAALRTATDANAGMQQHYETRKRTFAGSA